jgi:replicative DNA helicase
MNDNNWNLVNYETYIQSVDWQEKSEAAKKRALYRCQICNRHQDQVQLDTHHRTYERLGRETTEDLTVLCHNCHSLYSRYERLVKSNFFTPQKSRPAQPISELIKQYGRNPDEQLRENIPSGLVDFDKLTLGFNKSDFSLIAGHSGSGKTALAVGVALFAASLFNKKVVIFSLLHSSKQFFQKILLQSNDDNKVSDLETINILIDDTPAITPQNLRDKCFSLYGEKGIDLVIIDGLELMYTQNRAIGRKQELSEIAREIKTLARELDIPVLATTSEIASSERTDMRPNLNDLPNSLEQAADVVIFPYKKPDYMNYKENEDLKSDIRELIVAKNRNGSIGKVDIIFLKDIAKFVTPATRKAEAVKK